MLCITLVVFDLLASARLVCLVGVRDGILLTLMAHELAVRSSGEVFWNSDLLFQVEQFLLPSMSHDGAREVSLELLLDIQNLLQATKENSEFDIRKHHLPDVYRWLCEAINHVLVISSSMHPALRDELSSWQDVVYPNDIMLAHFDGVIELMHRVVHDVTCVMKERFMEARRKMRECEESCRVNAVMRCTSRAACHLADGRDWAGQARDRVERHRRLFFDLVVYIDDFLKHHPCNWFPSKMLEPALCLWFVPVVSLVEDAPARFRKRSVAWDDQRGDGKKQCVA